MVKPEGEVIIEPGAGVSSLIWRCQGLGNLENDEGKKFHTFVEHGRNSMKQFQNVFEKVRDPELERLCEKLVVSILPNPKTMKFQNHLC